MELPWVIKSVRFRATVTAYHPVDKNVPVIFPPFRLRSPKPPRAKREGNYRCRKTRVEDKTDFFTKRNMRAVVECLFVCWPAQKYLLMEHEYDVKNSYYIHCVYILKKDCERYLWPYVLNSWSWSYFEQLISECYHKEKRTKELTCSASETTLLFGWHHQVILFLAPPHPTTCQTFYCPNNE